MAETEKIRSGRPPMEIIKLTREARQKLDKLAATNADEIFRVLLEGARERDPTCVRILVDRLWPSRRGATITFTIPPIKNAADVEKAQGHFLEQVALGVMTPEEGNTVSAMLERRLKAFETAELAKQLEELRLQVGLATGEIECDLA